MGPKTRLQEELRAIGRPEEGINVQRMRPPTPGNRGVSRAPSPRDAMAAAMMQERASYENLERVSRQLADAGLSWSARDKAMDLYVEHGTDHIAYYFIGPDPTGGKAVGGRRMSAHDAQAIEAALLPKNNPNDDRAYFRALDLRAAGQPLSVAIAQAAQEERIFRATRPRVLKVQEFPPPPAPRIPPPPPRARRYSDIETPAQKRQNARDNYAAAGGIAVILAGLAALAWLVMGPDKPRQAPPRPAQLPPPVKPPAPPPRQPQAQPPPTVKQKAPTPRR